MNCREFSDHAAEIARAQMMDAGVRERALRHADACGLCAERLRRERSLTEALGATVESMSDASAPARVEAALVAAFRARRDAGRETVHVQSQGPSRPQSPPAHTPELTPAAAARSGRWTRRTVAASAVAASLILAFVVARRMRPTDAPAAASQVAARQSADQPVATQPTSASSSPASAPSLAPTQTQFAPAPKASDKGSRVRKPARVERAAGGQSLKKTLTELALAFELDGGQAVIVEDEGEATAGAGVVTTLSSDAEALTDFVQLSAGASATPMDGGQVVRVQAPRAALASLGLPVDLQRAGETVKADLLLAHDGTAHAIRLVR